MEEDECIQIGLGFFGAWFLVFMGKRDGGAL